MKRLSIIPEIFIWLAFSVLAGFGYAFTFFSYIGGREQMSAGDILLPMLVWLILAVACSCILRYAKKVGNPIRLTRGQARFLEGSILLLVLAGGWAFRYLGPFRELWFTNPDNVYFEYALVSQNADKLNSFGISHPASRLYVIFLHILFLLLGNIYEAGTLAQLVLLVAGAVFWYLAVRKSLGIVTALFLMAGAMLLPDSIRVSVQYNPMMLLFAVYGLIAWGLASLAESRRLWGVTAVASFGLGFLAGAASLLDISGLLLVFMSFFAWKKQWGRHQGKGFLITIAGVLGIGVGVLGCGYMLHQLFKISKVSLQLPDLEQIQQFVFSLSNRPIFLVALAVIAGYWFLKSRTACTWIMAGILALFAVQLLGLDVYMQHDFLIYMGILLLFGVAFEQLLMTKSVQQQSSQPAAAVALGNTTELPNLPYISEAVEKKTAYEAPQSVRMSGSAEPEVMVVDFDKAEAVTVLEKPAEKPVIFIPKSMEIAKRVPKPKVEYAVEVPEAQMHFDVKIDENADFDV